MNMTCKELKRIARENLTHHYGIPMGALLVAGIIPLAIELPFSMVQGEHPTLAQNIIFYIAEFLIALISYTLSAGVLYLHLNIARHKQYSLGMVFFPFRNRPDRFILAGLIELLIMLTGLIPVFAGIAIINYMDSPTGWLLFGILALVSFIIEILLALNLVLMVFFVIDHPDMRLWDCLRNSIHTMKGHKGKLLYIYLSFIGLQIMNLFSFGIGTLWISPYQTQTVVNFYLTAIGETPAERTKTTDSEPSPSFNQYI